MNEPGTRLLAHMQILDLQLEKENEEVEVLVKYMVQEDLLIIVTLHLTNIFEKLCKKWV